MSDKSKLMLSDGEMQLVINTGWILTKRKIIDTVELLFGELSVSLREKMNNFYPGLPPAVIASAPKIAKGENYLQLPYVMLDYPRCFDKENVFAVRTMFWWGHFFSCTLHLSGSYKTMFEQALLNNRIAMQQNGMYICINTNEWQHHFEEDNYVGVATLNEQEIKTILLQQHFVKIAARFSLQEWNTMDVLLERSFSEFMQLLKY